VILLIGTDVTEGTQLRQRLQTANNRLEDLLRHSGDIVMVLDSQYRITELFDNQKILFQQRASHFIHKGIDELVFSDDARKILVDTLDTACLSGRNAEASLNIFAKTKPYGSIFGCPRCLIKRVISKNCLHFQKHQPTERRRI
jgi:PAS domain-containing protein